jgi:ferredoxin
MPTLTIGEVSQEFPDGTRLVNAIEALGIDVGHRCGGRARCTTCRVTFEDGEPEAMTAAEAEKLLDKGLFGEARLSCQIVLDRDMTVAPAMTLQSEGWSDTGPAPSDAIEPEPTWTTRSEAAAG